MPEIRCQFVKETMGGDDVAVSVSFDDVFDGLDGLFEFPFLAEGLVCFASELLCVLFGLAVDARGVALGLHQQGFGLGVDIFRPDVAFLPFPVCVVFGLLEDSLGFGFEGFGFAYCGLEPLPHFLLGIGKVGVLGEGGEVLLGF